MPQTLPAARVVGHDFLGNHIGELLFRQPVTRAAAPSERTKGSSSGSTVCASDCNTIRRGSVASQHVLSPIKDSQFSTPTIDDLLSAGTTTLGASSDPVASLDQSSESSSSEPSSNDSKSGSADADLNILHLDQLSLTHQRISSRGGPTSPRLSFVTSFGAKQRSSGSRRAPSETGSSSYFGLSSDLSSAGMSPMEPFPAAISWNMPFRDQHQSFAKAIEHNARLNRNPSQQSHGSDAASSWHPANAVVSPSLRHQEVATPTTSAGSAVVGQKSQSFSVAESSQPVRQRLTRAATESTLEPIVQKQQPRPLPERPLDTPSTSSGSSLAHSKSMSSGSSGWRAHRRQPSLVQKGEDERTFTFVDPASSGDEVDDALVEEPEAEAPETTLTSIPMRSASHSSSSQSSSNSSFKEVLERQYSAHRRASTQTSLPASSHGTSNASPSIASVASTAKPNNHSSTSSPLAQSVVRDQYTRQGSVFPLKPPSSSGQNGASRPLRRLRIQPNMQSRPSLLERTMDEQRKASIAALTVNANGAQPEGKSSAPMPDSPEVPAQAPAPPICERYDTTAYGAEQRTFRINSTANAPNPTDFPFTMLSDEGGKPTDRSAPPASHARTSDWARAQSLLSSSSPVQDEPVSRSGSQLGYVGEEESHQVEQHRASTAQALLRMHTVSHSSTSTWTKTTSLGDMRDLLSPPETVISTPELESPPITAKISGADDGLDGARSRTSPLTA